MKVSNKKPAAGVLLHISSLPTGQLGQDAYQFVDFLSECGLKVWQTLPLNMPHGDGSPYQCLSAHAGNPAFICPKQPTAAINSPEFESFCRKHASWLDDFALFLCLRQQFNLASWHTWPVPYKQREKTAIQQAKQQYANEILAIQFAQFQFFTQWAALKQYANKKGIAMFGDIPIFVAFDSADVWANPHLFKLDKRCNMTVVAGVPPDYFSQTGQRWGNPHYRWRQMKADGYQWWLARMATQNRLFDMLRIDHFRGLQAAWEIPAKEETAVNGKWCRAPGAALLKSIKAKLPKICLVAEDLGIITPQVEALRTKFKLPGMKILQFAFGGGDDNYYLPANIEANSVVYTGTHDNDTSLGWYQTLEWNAKQHLHAVLGNENPNMPFDLVNLALNTQANLAVIPMQDILELDGASRMNTPGTMGQNWHWRFDWAQLTPALKAQFMQAVRDAGRAK